MRAIDMMKNEPMDKLLPEYLRFYVDWAGTDYSKDLAEMDLKNHPVFNLEEQLQMFDASEGPELAGRSGPVLCGHRQDLAGRAEKG